MKLPRDWLGPRSELVPFGPSADRQAEQAAATEAQDGRVIELVPPPNLTQDDFWGGALDAIPRPVVGPGPIEPGLPRRHAREVDVSPPAELAATAPAPQEVAPSHPADVPPAVAPTIRPGRRHERLSRRRAVGLVATAATVLVGGIGQALLAGGSSGPGTESLAVIKTPISSWPAATVSTADPLKPWRVPTRVTRTAAPHHRPAGHHPVRSSSPASTSYSGAASSVTYTVTRSSTHEPTASTSSTSSPSRPSTTRSAPAGPTGSGAPFGPGTLGS